MKVYGGWLIRRHDWPQVSDNVQVHGVIAAKSRRAAVDALREHGADVSRYFFDGYWSETGNDQEVATATAQPGRLFIKAMDAYNASFELVERGELKPQLDEQEQVT